MAEIPGCHPISILPSSPRNKIFTRVHGCPESRPHLPIILAWPWDRVLANGMLVTVSHTMFQDLSWWKPVCSLYTLFSIIFSLPEHNFHLRLGGQGSHSKDGKAGI